MGRLGVVMTVQELIDALSQIVDKSMPVAVHSSNPDWYFDNVSEIQIQRHPSAYGDDLFCLIREEG